MSRNGSGVYTKVNTFVSGNTITAAGHNQNWDDIASEITNSVAADGQTTMTGPLKASSGTAAAPSHTFGSDVNTGAYRIGSDNYGIAVGGTKIVDVATTGMTVTGALEGTTVKQNGFALIPVGFGPSPWSGLSAPSGWVLTGQTLSRTTYAALWAFAETEIAGGNTFYGVGDGSTTFTIASMGGRVPAGKEASASRLTSSYFGGDSTVLGAASGSESNALTLAKLPTGITATGTAAVTTGNAGVPIASASFSDLSFSPSGSGTHVPSAVGWSAATTLNGTASVTSNNTGGEAHANVQPTIITNYIIFAGV